MIVIATIPFILVPVRDAATAQFATTIVIDSGTNETMSFSGCMDFPMPMNEVIDSRMVKREGDIVSGDKPFFDTVSTVYSQMYLILYHNLPMTK